MEEGVKFGNPPAWIGDSAFMALGRYLKAKKDGVAPDPEDWEEIKGEADESAMEHLAEPSEKIYSEYGKLYKGFLQEVCRKTFAYAISPDCEDSDEAKDVASSLRYEMDRTARQGKPGTKGQLRDVLERHVDWLNLPTNQTTVSALNSWLKAHHREEKKAQKKVEKLKAAAQELSQTVQVGLDENAMRKLILREMTQQGRITEDQFTELCDRLKLNDLTVA